jgi:hypothetical protein
MPKIKYYCEFQTTKLTDPEKQKVDKKSRTDKNQPGSNLNDQKVEKKY